MSGMRDLEIAACGDAGWDEGVRDEQASFSCRHGRPWRRALDAKRQRCPLVSLEQAQRRPFRTGGTNSVRAWLVHGVTADVRPTRAGTRRLVGHGFLRRAWLRHLV